MKVLRWLWDRKFLLIVILSAIGGIILAVIFRQQPDSTSIADELEAIREGEAARNTAIDEGVDAAIKKADEKHADAIKAMDEKQLQKLEKLRRDPAARMRYLARLSRKRTGDVI